MPHDYRLYFKYAVLDELLERFRPPCVECHVNHPRRCDDVCEECYYASLPMCSCGSDKVMYRDISMCADCYWEDDYQQKRKRRARLYGDPEMFEEWRQKCAATLGVQYTPMSEKDRLQLLSNYTE